MDKYYQQVHDLLALNGAMGVNALQREMDIPLSTVQRYLERQSYFKKTADRKWDLPEKVAESEMSEANGNYQEIIDSQLKGIDAVFGMLTTQIKATVTLLSAQKPITPPVAGKTPEIHPRLLKIQETTAMMPVAIRQHKKNIPEEYLELLQRVDWIELCVDKGTLYYQTIMGTEVVELIAGNNDKLSDDVLEVLEKYQKEN